MTNLGGLSLCFFPLPCLTGISGLICLESDNECEGGSLHGSPKERETTSEHFGMAQSSKTSFSESARSFGKGSESNYIGLCSPSGVVLEGTDNEEFGPLTENLEFFYDRGGMKDNISHFEFAPSDVVAVRDYSLPGNANVIQIVGDSPTHNGHEDAISQVFLLIHTDVHFYCFINVLLTCTI